MSFQIFLLIGHFTNWARHNLLADKAFAEDNSRCLVIMSDHDVKLAGHFQNLVGQCPCGIVLNAMAERGISEQ